MLKNNNLDTTTEIVSSAPVDTDVEMTDEEMAAAKGIFSKKGIKVI